MKSIVKKFAPLLLALVLAIGLVPASAMGTPTAAEVEAQKQQIEIEGGDNSATASRGSIKIRKSVAPTGIENYFDITLTAQIEEHEKNNSTAVVLVMDTSNTMNSLYSNEASKTRLKSAQEAASHFIADYCSDVSLGDDRRLGLVTFNTDAKWASGLSISDLGNVANLSSVEIESIQEKVGNITAPSKPDGIRFTNMQAGLQLAYNALNSMPDIDNKYVIFLTDGFPTTYIDGSIPGNLTSTSSIKGYDPYESGSYSSSLAGTDGYFSDGVLKLPCTYGTSYSDKAAQKAQDTAAAMHATGKINIFSVGIDADGQSLKSYIESATSSYSVVDRSGTSYVVGDIDNTTAFAAWLGEKIAGGPSLTDSSHKYADSHDEKELETAFDNILDDIKVTSGVPMSVAYTLDPMGDRVEFLHFFDVNGNSADRLEGKSEEGKLAEDTAIYYLETDTINWDLLKSGYEISTASDGTRTYNYSIKYRVRLENEASSYNSGDDTPTNNTATFNYQTINPDGTQTANPPLAYPDPVVEGYKGQFSFHKYKEGGANPVAGAKFRLEHSPSACAKCLEAGHSVVIGAVEAASASDGLVSFTKIPSGHDYVLSEVQPASGYAESLDEWKVEVAYGNVTVSDLPGNKSTWNPSDPVVYNTPLTSAMVELHAIKSLKDSNGDALPIYSNDFKFMLTQTDINGDDLSSPTFLTQTVVNHGSSVAFAPLSFNTVGTYYFVVKEIAGSAAGVAYDGSRYFVTIEATESGGAIVPSVKYQKTSNAGAVVTEMAFDNVKSVGVAEVKAEKSLIGGTLSADQFVFHLEEKGTGKIVATAKNAADGKISFTGLKYYNPGTYEYVLHEVAGSDASVIYDDTKYDVTIKVDDVAPGADYATSVSITAKNGEPYAGAAAFSNTKRTPAKLALIATKTIDGKTPGLNQFDFKLTGDGIGSDIVKANDAQGFADFGEITFDSPGVYHYKVKENPGSDTSILYDSSEHNVSVVVTASSSGPTYDVRVFVNGKEIDPHKTPTTNGTLSGFDTYLAAHGGAAVFLPFMNSTKHFSAEIVASKLLNGSAAPDGAYSFELREGSPDATPIQVVNNNSFGHVEFSPITYYSDKLGSSFTYYVSEVKGTNPYTIYDDAVYKVTVSIPSAFPTGPGWIFPATVTYEKLEGGALVSVEDAVFENFTWAPTPIGASVSLSASKTLDGEACSDGKFTFELKDDKGNVVATASNGAGGAVSFGSLSFDKAGTYKYTVSEKDGTDEKIEYDSSVYEVVVTVIENASGNLSATTAVTKDSKAYSGTPVFANKTKYEPVDVAFGAIKTLDGKEPGGNAFLFALSKGGAIIEKATNSGSGAIAFGSQTFDTEGVYKFTLSEITGTDEKIEYDSSIYEITVTVTKGEDNKLEATTSVTKDGAAYSGTPAFANKTKPGPDPEDDPDPELPDTGVDPKPEGPIAPTGDGSPILALVALAMVAAAGIAIALRMMRRRA